MDEATFASAAGPFGARTGYGQLIRKAYATKSATVALKNFNDAVTLKA